MIHSSFTSQFAWSPLTGRLNKCVRLKNHALTRRLSRVGLAGTLAAAAAVVLTHAPSAMTSTSPAFRCRSAMNGAHHPKFACYHTLDLSKTLTFRASLRAGGGCSCVCVRSSASFTTSSMYLNQITLQKVFAEFIPATGSDRHLPTGHRQRVPQ